MCFITSINYQRYSVRAAVCPIVRASRCCTSASGRVEHVGAREPATARAADAEVQLPEIVGMVRVGRYRDERALLLRHAAMRIVEIAALRLLVEFEEAATLARMTNDACMSTKRGKSAER